MNKTESSMMFCPYCGEEQETQNTTGNYDRDGNITRYNYTMECSECRANSRVIIDFRPTKQNVIHY